MHFRPAAFVTVVVVACMWPVAAAGQGEAAGEATWTVPRLPDGRPDLQGYWTTQTFTPLERPDYLAGKEFFTEEELAALQQQFTAEGVDPVARSAINLEDPEERERRLRQTQENIHYDNAIWLGTSVPKGLSSRRTSLITDLSWSGASCGRTKARRYCRPPTTTFTRSSKRLTTS